MSANRKLKPSPPPRPLPLKWALGLGALVLLIHWWLLGSAPLQLSVQATPPAPLKFSTRRIEAAPAGPASPAVAARSTRPAAPSARPAPPAPRPADPAEPDRTSAQAPPAAEATPAEPALAAAQPVAESSPPGPAAPRLQLPGSVRLQYDMSGQSRGLSYSADAQMTWQQDGRHYDARMVISALLMLHPRVMTSTGEVGELGLAPRRFSDKGRSEQATHFQPEQGRIVFSGNAPQAPWQPGVQDRLSIFFQLAGLLAGDPARYTPGTQVQLPTASTRELDSWTFTVVGTPTLALPAGEQATVALRREPRRPYDQTVEIWFAPALGHLPVRIRITQANGDVLDQRLASVHPL